MSNREKVDFRDILQTTTYNRYKLGKEKKAGRDRYIKYELDDDLRNNLFLNKKLKGRGIEKIVIPSNIIDIYNRLEVLLGLKISGHTETLTEASALIDEIYKRGETQNKQQNRKALNKISNI